MSRYPLELDGWEEASVWGWDAAVESYFAELYRNTDDTVEDDIDDDDVDAWDEQDCVDDEDQVVWLHGVDRPMTSEGALAAAISAATAEPAEKVLAAMCAGAPPAGRAARAGQAFVNIATDPSIFYEQDLELEAAPDERDLVAQGWMCCWCYSVRCPDGEFGHIHRSSVIPIHWELFAEAARAGWELPVRVLRLAWESR